MRLIWPAVYFVLLAATHLATLFARFFLPGMSGAAPTGVFLLVSIPFALLAIVWPQLRPRQFAYFLILNLLLQSLVYTGTGLWGSEALQIHFKRYGITPLLQSQGILLLLCGLLALGVQMKARHRQPLLRRRGSDKEELENLYELKTKQLPEAGLTFFRYRQLLGTGIGIVASRGIDLLASIQLLTRARTFFLYDLVGGPRKEQQAHGILFLFENLLSRPEIRLNAPERIIYLFRAADRRLRLLLEDSGFKRVELSDASTTGWRENLDSALKIEFEDWRPFADLECYYVLEMNDMADAREPDH